MDEDTVERLVWEYYEEVKLPEDRIQTILDGVPALEKVVRPRFGALWMPWAAAACLMMTFGAGWALSQRTAKAESAKLAHQVMDVFEHQLAPEVYSNDWQSIELGLRQTEFPIAPSDMDNLQGYVVVGARHCEYSGQRAVHVILAGKENGEQGCLYILPYQKELKRIREPDVWVGNQHVSMWNDNNRLFALYNPSR